MYCCCNILSVSSSSHTFKGGVVEAAGGEGASNCNGNSNTAAFKGGSVEDTVAAFFQSLLLLIQF
ncbi:hypothetical protein glysoja_049283 [Glycine soja]|uniref:Uncharacterized protein n=1 Tax=Glycine soja TaxID=3848 RepID=A0A0B2PZN7_GLYSO|nr:hypothetical protein glysoja_049283 [Glycine soja]